MKRKVWHNILFILLYLAIGGRSLMASHATFVPNKGQWNGNFQFKANLSAGAVFFDNKGFHALLIPGEGHHHVGMEDSPSPLFQEAVNVRMMWLNAQTDTIISSEEEGYYHNYILGKDPSKWKSKVPVYKNLRYVDIYPGIDALYHTSSEGEFKYDINIAPNADPNMIRMKYSGVTGISIHNGKLKINTKLGHLEEYIPIAYQLIDGRKKTVSCHYKIENGEIGFKLGKYDPAHELIIDPILIFSTFSGSIANNFGYTATYDNDGYFYGGGTALGVGFQATPGVVQVPFGGGDMDVTISKFSPDGSSLIYATHLGGSYSDAPHSLNITPQNELLILGNTDSDNFPTTPGAFQSTFVQGPPFNRTLFPFFHRGSNIFVAKLNSSGTSLLASTLFGDSLGDGINTEIYKNYGDKSRGDILTLPNGNIAFTSSSFSKNLPLNLNGISSNSLKQKAVAVVFNSNLSQVVWGNYFGGDGDETGYSLKSDGTYLYISGSTTSSNLPNTTGSLNSSPLGKMDGYVAKFQISNGSLVRSTYIGGTEDDQAFFLDLDKDNYVYLHGQTQSVLPISSNTYGTSNAWQFIQKLNDSLNNLEWSTTVGTGTKSDWVPTAFMIDQCYNIYLSGWNGAVNDGVAGNTFNDHNTNGLPTSQDAFQKTTDGSDFYFMILSKDAQSFLFGTYFGGTSEEHVDGGTSRFSPKGIIYQAVCAACYVGTFPTTPSSYSPTKPNNKCNLGAIKIDFQQTVRALVSINASTGFDTICDTLLVKFSNNSMHANKFTWDLGNGQTSNQYQPIAKYPSFGTYTITLIAEDTICDLADTTTIVIDHTKGETVISDFEMQYAGCDKNYEVTFTNQSLNTDSYQWDFGDGTTSSAQDPIHSFPDSGSYIVQLIAINAACNKRDTLRKSITFIDTISAPNVRTSISECSNGQIDVELINSRKRYEYSWTYNGKTYFGENPAIFFDSRGVFKVQLEVIDTLCNVSYPFDFEIKVQAIHKPTYVPNAFTPNGDGINDKFEMSGESCQGDEYMRIYNRWGQLIFETNEPFTTFWDGTYQGSPAQQGVYTYTLKVGKKVIRNQITLIR